MAMNCICCGKTFKYGWQIKENIGVCEDCIKPVEIHLNNASVELNDLKNTNTFEETKNKVISTLNAEDDKETIEYLTALLDKIYSVFTSNTTDNQTITPLNHSNNINIPTVSVSNSSSTGMFGNIGGKIKTLAQVVTWIGIIASVISGFAIMSIDEEMIFVGLMVMIFGALMSWVSSFVLYGFGQLVENSDKLVKMSKK